MMQNAKRVSQIKSARFERQLFGISDSNGFWLGQLIHRDSVSQIFQRLRRQINPGRNRSCAQPLNKIGPGPEANLQHFLVMVPAELSKRMDEWLVEIPIPFNFLEIISRKLRCLGDVSVAALSVPEIPYLLFEFFWLWSLHALGKH